MIRLAALVAAAVLFFVPPVTAPMTSVIAGSAIGALFAALGIVTLWRWPTTVAACVFLADYAAALWAAAPAVNVPGAASVGVALLVLLHSSELARAARRATVDARVVGSQAVRSLAFVAATLGGAVAVVALARIVAVGVPRAGAPILAAAGALGVVVALAALYLTSEGAAG
jgi:hypothetical protein